MNVLDLMRKEFNDFDDRRIYSGFWSSKEVRAPRNTRGHSASHVNL